MLYSKIYGRVNARFTCGTTSGSDGLAAPETLKPSALVPPKLTKKHKTSANTTAELNVLYRVYLTVPTRRFA